MNKPYIACHMMMVLDGRIDCGMTSKVKGVDKYYATLTALDVPSRVSGCTTAALEMADKGEGFISHDTTAYGKEGFSKKVDAAAYEIITDTHGSLRWDGWTRERPLLVVTSTRVSREYLAYLDALDISWIVCGEDHIDLARACAILADEFGVARMAVVGGGHINAVFLDAGLLDEVSILLAPAIDGRGGMAAVFDGLPMDCEPVHLTLTSARTYDDGALWLRYTVKDRA